VDLDGDGIGDIVSGSWPGELYFFKGQGKGKFAPGQTLKDKDGKTINTGSASTVFATDWRGTGKLDLLVGSVEGFVWLIPNDGTKEKAEYGKPVKLEAAGKLIQVTHGDSHPVAADWEGTGKPGLVVGCGDGSVVWYRNIGTRSEPKLAAAQSLVPAPPPADPTKPSTSKEPVRGTRAKVWVGDFDGDGRFDLLVGDFAMSYGPEPKLSDADKAAKKELEGKLQKVNKDLQPYFKEINELYNKGDSKTPEGQKELNKKYEEVAKKYQTELNENSKIHTQLRKYQRPFEYHGHVWLFRGQQPVRSAKR
jgi:hypothetical protein